MIALQDSNAAVWGSVRGALSWQPTLFAMAEGGLFVSEVVFFFFFFFFL